MRFRKRPFEVDAIQWDGSNAEAVIEFTKGAFEAGSDSFDPEGATAYLFTGKSYDNKGDYLETGAWIIRFAAGHYRSGSDAWFRDAYEPVEDGS